MIHGKELILPYAMSDKATAVASDSFARAARRAEGDGCLSFRKQGPLT